MEGEIGTVRLREYQSDNGIFELCSEVGSGACQAEGTTDTKTIQSIKEFDTCKELKTS